VMVLGGLLGAIFWNLFPWYFGIPSSSSHALLGGVLGAAVAQSGWSAVKADNATKTLKGLFISPLFGFVMAMVLMVVVTWIVRRMRPMVVNRAFRWLQMLSAGGMAFSHGSADAQKTMGIIWMALVGFQKMGASVPSWFPSSIAEAMFPAADGALPGWVKVTCALAMAVGTAAGGVRIIKTMGTKIIELKPIHGFVAETSAALTIMIAAKIGAPVSTTHVISSSIIGVGATQRVSAVRWGVTTKILWAWVLTIPISFAVGALFFYAVRAITGG
jgi:inorganic phosphate transporter, PiT family